MSESDRRIPAWARRATLQQYARRQLAGANKAQAFINIVAKAAELVRDQSLPGSAMIDDLQQVLIGEGLTEGRGTGRHYVGNNRAYNGVSGFKAEFGPDEYFQVQHAAAGLVIGYRYAKLGEWGARWVEDEPQDDALYRATCPIGQWLENDEFFWGNDDAYKELPGRLLEAICDGSCELPSAEVDFADMANQPAGQAPVAHTFDAATSAPDEGGMYLPGDDQAGGDGSGVCLPGDD